jgi:hypothetical protein
MFCAVAMQDVISAAVARQAMRTQYFVIQNTPLLTTMRCGEPSLRKIVIFRLFHKQNDYFLSKSIGATKLLPNRAAPPEIELMRDCCGSLTSPGGGLERATAKMGQLLRVSLVAALCILWDRGALGQGSQSSTSSAATPANGTQKASSPIQAPTLSPAEKRRADLLADTEKLYQLTQELKAEVARSNKDTLSVSVVKKAQEVERLAKSIKERSRGQ